MVETEAYARGSDPDTSHEAAERMEPSKLEQHVFDCLMAQGIWLTSTEVAKIMGVHLVSVSPRFRPLWRKGLIEEGKKLALNTNGKMRLMQAWRAIRPKPEQLDLLEGSGNG